MGVSAEQTEILQRIIQGTEERLATPVVADLYKVYYSLGCLDGLARLITRMPAANREPLIHTLGSHVTKEKPVFVYAVGGSLGTDPLCNAMLAASIDMLWSLSLIMDDIEDNDAMRSGKESAWVKYGKLLSIACVQSGLTAVQEGIEECFGSKGWLVMDNYIAKAVESIKQHKSFTFETSTTDLVGNYVDRNDFYCAAPVEILSLAGSNLGDGAAVDALRKVTIAGQVLNDLKDIWPQFEHIRPSFSDIRNHLVTIPIKQMYDGLGVTQRIDFDRLWKMDPAEPKVLSGLAELIMASGINGQVTQQIKQTYLESVVDFEFTVSNPNLRTVFRKWVEYKLAQCGL